MTTQTVTLSLPTVVLHAVQDIAAEREVTIAKVVEDILIRVMADKATAKKMDDTDPRLIFALQKLLFQDMAEASSWQDLSDRLSKHGYWLKIGWGGLSLHTETSGQRLCKTSDLGFAYGTFLRRFGGGKPVSPFDDPVKTAKPFVQAAE